MYCGIWAKLEHGIISEVVAIPRIIEISCHLGRKSSHLAAALASDKHSLCKLQTSVLADLSKSVLFYDGRTAPELLGKYEGEL
jgi:hypothetical protein